MTSRAGWVGRFFLIGAAALVAVASACSSEEEPNRPLPWYPTPTACPEISGNVSLLGDGRMIGATSSRVVAQFGGQSVWSTSTPTGELQIIDPPSSYTWAFGPSVVENAVAFATSVGSFQVVSLDGSQERRAVEVPLNRRITNLTGSDHDAFYLLTATQENPTTPGGPRAVERYRLGEARPQLLHELSAGPADGIFDFQAAGDRVLWVEVTSASTRVVLLELSTLQEREIYVVLTPGDGVAHAKLVGDFVFVALSGADRSLLQLRAGDGTRVASYGVPAYEVPLFDAVVAGGRIFAASEPLASFRGDCWRPELFELSLPSEPGGVGSSVALSRGGNGQLATRNGFLYLSSSETCCGTACFQWPSSVACVKL